MRVTIVGEWQETTTEAFGARSSVHTSGADLIWTAGLEADIEDVATVFVDYSKGWGRGSYNFRDAALPPVEVEDGDLMTFGVGFKY